MIPVRPHRLRRALTSRSPIAGWAWMLPVPVAAFLYLSPLAGVQIGVGVLLGLAAVLLFSRRPDRALLALIALLPFSTLLLALLYRVGVPLSIVRPMGAWKEAVVLGVVVAAVRDFSASGRRLDSLDRLALVFIAIAGTYAILAPVFLAQAPAGGEIRFLGFRQSAGLVVLLLAARHARLPSDFPARAMRVVLAACLTVAAIGVYEFFFSLSWNDLVVNQLAFARYQIEVLHIQPFNPADYRIHGSLGDREILRVGSVFFSAASCGFYLVIGFAVLVERIFRQGARPAMLAALALIGGVLILTQTRSAVLGALVVAFFAFRPAGGRGPARRVRFGLVLAALALLAAPAVTTTGLAERTIRGATGEEASADYHVQALVKGLGVIAAHPLGQGLGTSAGTGQRFAAPNVVISENNYVQVGTELGLLGMIAFVALTFVYLRELRRAARRTGDPALAALSGAAIALAIGALFLHTWNDFAVAWTSWGLAGAALGVVGHRAHAAAVTRLPNLEPTVKAGRSALPGTAMTTGRYAEGR